MTDGTYDEAKAAAKRWPTPKQREERELAVVREELALHKGDILSDFVARRRGAARAEDVDRRARRILSRLRTHSPEERTGVYRWREKSPKGEVVVECPGYWPDSSGQKCGRCLRSRWPHSEENWVDADSPEEPVGEEEAVALAKSYGYVVIHRSAWEFMRESVDPGAWSKLIDCREDEAEALGHLVGTYERDGRLVDCASKMIDMGYDAAQLNALVCWVLGDEEPEPRVPEEPGGWRLIETAPEGEHLLYFPRKQAGRNHYLEARVTVDVCPVIHPRKPTHWMPLPEPPIGQPGEQS